MKRSLTIAVVVLAISIFPKLDSFSASASDMSPYQNVITTNLGLDAQTQQIANQLLSHQFCNTLWRYKGQKFANIVFCSLLPSGIHFISKGLVEFDIETGAPAVNDSVGEHMVNVIVGSNFYISVLANQINGKSSSGLATVDIFRVAKLLGGAIGTNYRSDDECDRAFLTGVNHALKSDPTLKTYANLCMKAFPQLARDRNSGLDLLTTWSGTLGSSSNGLSNSPAVPKPSTPASIFIGKLNSFGPDKWQLDPASPTSELAPYKFLNAYMSQNQCEIYLFKTPDDAQSGFDSHLIPYMYVWKGTDNSSGLGVLVGRSSIYSVNCLKQVWKVAS